MHCFYAFTVDLQSLVSGYWIENSFMSPQKVLGQLWLEAARSVHAVFQTTSGWKWPTAAQIIAQYHISIQHPFNCSDELKWQVKMPPPQPPCMIYGKEAKTIIAFLLLLFFQG